MALPVPEPELTPGEMIARAAAMREHLRSEQQATEERTYYSLQTHEAFTDAGFYRVLQPRRFGGYEFGIDTFYEVVMELSRGCPSTGWCYSLGSAHVLQLVAFFPEATQAEVLGPDGHFIAASRDNPGGTVRPVDAGYVVQGTWNYCSGAPYSTHFIARARMLDEHGEAPADGPLALVVIPREQWTMLDDWHGMLGLRGTGSHSISVQDAEVPAGYVTTEDPFNLAADQGVVATAGNPIYSTRHFNFFHGEIASIMTGAAFAAADEYERIIRTSKTYDPFPPGRPRAEMQDYQRPLGLGIARAEAARHITLGAARDYTDRVHRAAAGETPYTLADDLMLESVHAQAAVLAFTAIENLAQMAGSSNSARDGRRMQRYLRDALVYRSHQQGAMVEVMATKFAQERLRSHPTE